MEDLIATLEEQLRAQARPVSPNTRSRQASSALEIDNEALREQVQHLLKKASTLEDQLEDARMFAEREEASVLERTVRYKEREDSIREELAESQKAVERVTKSEEAARSRIEEMEEALRENTVALENARAEIEGLRAEISVRRTATFCAGAKTDEHVRIWRASLLPAVHQRPRDPRVKRTAHTSCSRLRNLRYMLPCFHCHPFYKPVY